MIIDTHVHIGSSMKFVMTEQQVLRSMDENAIDYSVVSNCEAATHDHNRQLLPQSKLTSQVDCFERVLRFARENPGRIGAALWVRPGQERVTSELRNLITDNIDVVHAVKFHPYHAGVSFCSEECGEYIRLAQDFSLPVICHTGANPDDSPARVYEMAVKYPQVDFVMVHLGLSTDNAEAIRLCSQRENLYGDTTWVPTQSVIKFIRECSPDRIVFGSDNPIDGENTYKENYKGDRSLYQEYFNEFKDEVSPEVYDKLMYKNARRLFRISSDEILGNTHK